MSVFICDKDTLAVFDIFLAGFYGSHKVNLQNFYINELTKWFSLKTPTESILYSIPQNSRLLYLPS